MNGAPPKLSTFRGSVVANLIARAMVEGINPVTEQPDPTYVRRRILEKFWAMVEHRDADTRNTLDLFRLLLEVFDRGQWATQGPARVTNFIYADQAVEQEERDRLAVEASPPAPEPEPTATQRTLRELLNTQAKALPPPRGTGHVLGAGGAYTDPEGEEWLQL